MSSAEVLGSELKRSMRSKWASIILGVGIELITFLLGFIVQDVPSELIVAGCCVGGIFILGGIVLSWIEKKDQATFEQDTKKLQRLVSDLGVLASEHTIARVVIATVEYRSLAEALKSVFDQAKWKTKGIPYPLDRSHPQNYVKGIEVQGFNKHLVESIVKALQRAGLKDAVAKVDKLNRKPANRAYFTIVSQHIVITIGHREH